MHTSIDKNTQQKYFYLGIWIDFLEIMCSQISENLFNGIAYGYLIWLENKYFQRLLKTVKNGAKFKILIDFGHKRKENIRKHDLSWHEFP